MSTHLRICRVNGAYGALYLFDDPGDGIRMHKHDEANAHSTEVIGGSVMIYGPDGFNKIVATEGQLIELEWDKYHEIRAVSPHAIIFNKYINGVPPAILEAEDESLWSNVVPILTHNLLEDGTLVMKEEWRSVFI